MTEQEAIKNLTAYAYMEFENIPKQVIQALDIAKNAIKEIQRYRAIEKRLADMFGGELSLAEYVDELEKAMTEPDKPHPVNARILTYEDADMWEAYKAIGTVEECRAAVEKQIPKKPAKNKDGDMICSCGLVVRYKGRLCGLYFCHNCGQAIDWSDK